MRTTQNISYSSTALTDNESLSLLLLVIGVKFTCDCDRGESRSPLRHALDSQGGDVQQQLLRQITRDGGDADDPDPHFVTMTQEKIDRNRYSNEAHIVRLHFAFVRYIYI